MGGRRKEPSDRRSAHQVTWEACLTWRVPPCLTVSGTSGRKLWRIITVLLLFIGIFGGSALGAFVFGGGESALSMLFIGAGSFVGATLTTLILFPRRARKYARQGQVECALRVIAGHEPALGHRWQHGLGTLALGELTFRGTVGGIRFARRSPTTVEVAQIDRSTRTTGWGEAWSITPGLEVVQLVTPSARLEWALPPGKVQWATDRLSPSQAGAGETG